MAQHHQSAAAYPLVSTGRVHRPMVDAGRFCRYIAGGAGRFSGTDGNQRRRGRRGLWRGGDPDHAGGHELRSAAQLGSGRRKRDRYA
ncbi:hypothetical protein G6F50_018182 [Rhizopus delemar]|uniref:Uncharacterized protein n=1 Tax=Rhizopus delemar TaxID=936053 RepID=A0A9P7BZK1_9FUNG|nr:hypothetical protein G6F50_018182 [Rhizopus delemar]